jgi:hypothetical protein
MGRWWPHLAVGDGHLDEAALLLLAAGPAVDRSPAWADHVAACPTCAGRLAELSALCLDVRGDAAADADAAFPETRLARQRALIGRRLAQQGQPARILRFPATSRPVRDRRVARRSVAAAAVIGLLVGMAAGRFIDGRPVPSTLVRVTPTSHPAGVPGGTPPRPVGRMADLHDDERLLFELDVAAATPRIEPLRAIDAMTPRIGDAARRSPQ